MVERRNRVNQDHDDFIDMEILSSPPSRPKSPIDDDITLLSFEPLQQDAAVTPMGLGGSRFRRKQIVPTDISSPITVSATHGLDIPAIPLFEADELLPSVSSSDLVKAIPSIARPESPPLASRPPLPSHLQTVKACTSSGEVISISKKPEWKKVIASHERQAAAKAQKRAYYGVDIHRLLDDIETAPNQSQLLTYNLSYMVLLI